MGYSTCVPHNLRTCDGCDSCSRCEAARTGEPWRLHTHLYCWRCCGRLDACPKCALRLAQHVVSKGPPEGEWANQRDVMAGYRRAVGILYRHGITDEHGNFGGPDTRYGPRLGY